MATVVETERLLLRHCELDDAPFVNQLLNDPMYIRFIADRGVRSDDDARVYIANGPLASYAQHGFGLNVVIHKETALPIGMCGLLKRPALDHPDVGYGFLPQFRGGGYAYEAAVAVIAHGVANFGVKYVHAVVDADNEASIKLLHKLGMTRVGVTRLPPDEKELELFGRRWVE